MKASEVLRRYAGERDFRRTNLRGQSFKGQDLSGADFSEADIRGTHFTRATLNGVTFVKAKAGVQKRWRLMQQLLACLVSALAAFLSALLGGSIAVLFFNPSLERPTHYIVGIIILGLVAFIFAAIARQGFTTNAATTISVAFAVAVAVAVPSTISGVVSGIFPSTVAVAFPIAVAVVVAFAVAVAVADVGIAAIIFAVAVVSAIASLGTFAAGPNDGIIIGTAAFTVASFLLGIFCRHCAFKGDKKFALICSVGVASAALGGTSFRGANLTHANFSQTMLKGTNFNHTKHQQTILDWVCWQDAKNLDRARLGNSILSNPAVRELLVTHNGYKKAYVDANLRGANLNGVNLNEANLKWADLSEATLHHADLRRADLSETLVLGTDFTGAFLTGACLEGWNIDHTTNLEGVDCQYVYLLRNQQERRPSSGDFAPGEFTKLFQEVLSTVDLIFRNGVDWKAFVAAFKQVQVENDDMPLEIQSIENKGDGVVVVRVNVPPDTNKEKIHSEFNQQYELALKALEARYQAELQAKEGEITIYREQSANMWGVINSLANRPINVQAIAEAKAMNDSTDSSRKIEIGNIGGDFNASGQALNLGDISGTVTNTINQLPDAADPDQPDLKQLLIQLKDAIATDADLPDTDKADLLEQVQLLAEAKQTEEPTKKEGLARKSKKIFEATLKSLPETAKVAEACSKLLPMILKALGLPV